MESSFINLFKSKVPCTLLILNLKKPINIKKYLNSINNIYLKKISIHGLKLHLYLYYQIKDISKN
jgi:hypothetical protein